MSADRRRPFVLARTTILSALTVRDLVSFNLFIQHVDAKEEPRGYLQSAV
jgi:hypothetical protein